MVHKLVAAELRPGMYVVDTGKPWTQSPYLYATEGELATEQLSWLLNEGYTEAYVDLTRSRPGSLPPHLLAMIKSDSPLVELKDFSPPPPRVSLKEELPKAQTVFQNSLSLARDLMTNMRQGSFDPPAAEPVVEGILESLDRNANALLGLGKLRQKDDYTYTHCVNVSVLSVMFARGLGFSGDGLHAVGMGALFHDIGKALIPLSILNAPRRLNDQEMAAMRKHPLLGWEQLQRHKGLRPEVLQLTLEHHEQYAGTGYPFKKAGDAISMPGRIAAIVDVFDALSSRRVYKDPMPLSKTLSTMYSMRGKEFSPTMLEKFIKLLGVYPVGSAVELEDGSLSVVSMPNPAKPLQPKVILVRDGNNISLGNKERDLSEDGSPGIIKTITAKELGIDPATVLGM